MCLSLCKVVFRVLLVLVLAPSPVVVSSVGNKQIVAYHFDGIQLTVKLWQEKALMAFTLDKHL
jgi:hypothetical protein